ncbi:hypothetical protein D3C72_1873760 [compost metagenome]
MLSVPGIDNRAYCPGRKSSGVVVSRARCRIAVLAEICLTSVTVALSCSGPEALHRVEAKSK